MKVAARCVLGTFEIKGAIAVWYLYNMNFMSIKYQFCTSLSK